MNMKRNIILLYIISNCWAQNINSPALDWIQTDGTGAYRYGYATGDEGRHYHVQSAKADNTVAGKFGYKDPATGKGQETTYTAGKRGFRARGPHIARRMDLSQNKPPFSRPDDDGQYHPELNNYFDPDEDRGYDFSYRTPDHIKEEHANRVGDVQGRYSYLDDIGFRHDVNYIAGSRTGFLVTNPVPDTFAQARGGPLYYVGKTGGSKVRGYSAVQRNLNGAYRFLASGPDHKRSEISDAFGNRRGIYTYLDDKGVQHTVEYIAGPKIGYKVIANKKGTNYNPFIPYFQDSPAIPPLFPLLVDSGPGKSSTPFPDISLPTSTPNIFPTGSSTGKDPFPLSGGGDDFLLNGKATGSAGEGEPFLFGPTQSSGPPSSLPSASSGPSSKPPSALFKPSTTPSLFTTTTSKPIDKLDQGGIFPSPGFSSTISPFTPSTPSWNFDDNFFFTQPPSANTKTPSRKPSTAKGPPLIAFPTFFPSAFPDLTFEGFDSFADSLHTAESGNGLKPPCDQKETNCNKTAENGTKEGNTGSDYRGKDHKQDRDRFDTNFPSSDSKKTKENDGKHFYKDHKFLAYPSRGTVKFGGVKKNEWHKLSKDDGYFAIPPGVAVRAHVQSLDIVPFGRRFLSPSETLDRDEKEEKKHKDH